MRTRFALLERLRIFTSNMNLLRVTVHNRTGLLFKGEANAVSATNEKGVFDVLPEHANYLTLIEKEVKIHLPTDEKTFQVTRGMLSAVDNDVTILLGITSAK